MKARLADERNREVRGQLRSSYLRSGLVLVVGAGLSAGTKLPLWPEVLRRLAGQCFGKRLGSKVFRTLVSQGYSLPAIASILESSSPSPQIFTHWLRDELYRGFPFYGVVLNDDNKSDFVRYVGQNATLRACAAFCVRRAPGLEGFVRNAHVQAVVNFNFDAIFREYVRLRFGHGILRTIERPSAGSLPKRTPVYQMHGYFHFDRSKFYNLAAEAPDVRVFTEQEYFDFFNRPTSIYNYTFLHLLREYNCVFVGLSLQDENIRRLLHYSKTERTESDVREGKPISEAEQRAKRHFILLTRGGDQLTEQLREASLGRLGLRVAWLENYGEIPDFLGDLYSSTGDKWGEVY